jgi:hypothetical protein
MKRLITIVMAACLVLSLAVTATAAVSAFSDVQDPALARDVAVLQMLGAVSGDGSGSFMPGGTLTRAAFCKMAVIVMGKGDQEPIYRSRTIFPDVRSGYWAIGYINLAVSGEKKLIIGGSDGLFRPEEPISVAQAVTILMRMLGYADADAGMLWPAGYLALAKDTGLTAGVDTSNSGSPMTRAQAAHLFVSLLASNVKGGGSYAATIGTATADAIVMQLNVTASDGTTGAVRTSAGILKTVNGILPPAILGLRGTLLKDSSGRFLTLIPDKKQQLTVTASSTVNATWLKDMSGVRYNIPADAPAYTPAETKTYGTAYMEIASGMTITLYFAADGNINGVYINTLKYGDAVVIGGAGSLGQLTGGDVDYKIYKNGAPATEADVRPYDVATYDSTARILYVTDFRLTGVYENAWPSIGSPSKITVMGHEFPVLPSAIDSLVSCKIGQGITLLLTTDLQVAGVVSNGSVTSTAIGIVQKATATDASVKLLNGLVLSGNASLTDVSASKYVGELVLVSSSGAGMINLSRLNGNNYSGDLDLTKATLGTLQLSPALRIFERVGTGAVTQITLGDLAQSRISSSNILYVATDYNGRVATLVLNDVTGDRYIYGYLKKVEVDGGYFNGTQVKNSGVIVINSTNKTGSTAYTTGYVFTSDVPGGVAVSTDGETVTAIMTLSEARGIKRSAFYVRNDVTYVSLNGTEFPVPSTVECYNSQGKTWFSSLTDARAYAETLTVYYDRAATEGGKVRMVVAE